MQNNFDRVNSLDFFYFIWVLRPFQEYFTYIEPMVHPRWVKTGEPREKNTRPFTSLDCVSIPTLNALKTCVKYSISMVNSKYIEDNCGVIRDCQSVRVLSQCKSSTTCKIYSLRSAAVQPQQSAYFQRTC